MNVSTKLLVQISAHSAQFVAGINQANKHLNVLQKSIISLKNTLLGTFGAYAVINGIQAAVNTLAEFDKEMTAVRAITGAAGEDFDKLEKSALKLGSTTQYTAKEVAALQLEFGRLGFSTKEILDSTKATVDLATATGEGLARSAEIAGSTLRAFQLDATEMGRVVDVMAGALNRSALTLDSFADGIKYVSPVAKATGVSLEETAAMMSVLADAGIKGTQAGTSLRRIFTMLTKDGRPLAEKLQELSDRGLDLAGANDEVGLYAQTALLHLTAMLPRVQELTEAYKNNTGEASSVARIMEDNLATSIKKAGTAYDSWILSMKESKGVIKGVADEIARFFLVMAGGEGADLIRFQEILRAIQGSLQQGNGVRFGQFNTLKDLAKELGKELIIVRDELGKITAIYERSGDALLGPPPKESIESLGIVKQIAEYNTKITAAKAESLKVSEEQRKEEERLVDLAIQRAQVETDKRVRELDLKYAPPTGMAGFEKSGQYNPVMPNDPYSAMKAGLESINRLIDENNKKQAENRANIIATRMEYAMMADQIGDSITRVIAGEFSMADAFRIVTAEILDEIQKRIIANIAEGSSKLFALNPLLGIAAVTAGFAVTKGLLKRIGNSQSTKQNSRSLEVYGQFEMSGRTAVALVRAGNRSNSITGG